ncbi:MAG: DNA polymerase I, partial [Chlamydiae bacterium]|nr:DNA polymerase I [Chlamydiota bacterium]
LPFSIHPKTGRIHCTFSQSVAATGRLSCQNPNLQNIPVRTKEGLAIRKCFKPARAGWSYLSADYSQIELRLLAHFSEDPELMRAFQSNQDIHTHTAALIYDIFPEMVTPEMRSLSKAVNFGIIYGQSPFGLSRQLGITLQEAAQFIQTYFERYPKVSAYLESCKESARKTGMATTLTGRQRPIPEITNKNPTIRSAAERLAVNTPLQGTQADLIKIAMIQIDEVIQERNLKGKMILQIHDELLFEIPDEEIPTFEKVVKEKMEQVVHLNIPLEVKVSVGKNWAAC